MHYPQHATIVEVGPRDGLQNEAVFVPTSAKIEFIDRLSRSGLTRIEATSFVSPHAIPQLADNKDVMAGIQKPKGVMFSALVPNMLGLEAALAAHVGEIAVFTAASETFNQRNIHCSIADSLKRIEPVVEAAKVHGLKVRGYVSCVIGCPYEGAISPFAVAHVVKPLLAMGVDEISLGDTIGVGTPKQTQHLIEALLPTVSPNQLAMHFHDTYGQAIANVAQALQCGITCFDSAAAGLGGCPYARGATGNVATEDLIYLMHGLGIETGIDIYQVVQAGEKMCQTMNRPNQSKVANALLAKGPSF